MYCMSKKYSPHTKDILDIWQGSIQEPPADPVCGLWILAQCDTNSSLKLELIREQFSTISLFRSQLILQMPYISLLFASLTNYTGSCVGRVVRSEHGTYIQMVTQNRMRTQEVKQGCSEKKIGFVAALDLSKCHRQIN